MGPRRHRVSRGRAPHARPPRVRERNDARLARTSRVGPATVLARLLSCSTRAVAAARARAGLTRTDRDRVAIAQLARPWPQRGLRPSLPSCGRSWCRRLFAHASTRSCTGEAETVSDLSARLTAAAPPAAAREPWRSPLAARAVRRKRTPIAASAARRALCFSPRPPAGRAGRPRRPHRRPRRRPRCRAAASLYRSRGSRSRSRVACGSSAPAGGSGGAGIIIWPASSLRGPVRAARAAACVKSFQTRALRGERRSWRCAAAALCPRTGAMRCAGGAGARMSMRT